MGALLVPVALLVVHSVKFHESDIFWEARSGIGILGGSGIIHSDTFSWSASGSRWVPNSWAWDTVLGESWRLAGYAGLTLVAIVSTSVLFALLGWQAKRSGALPAATGIALAAIALGLADYMVQRPQLASYVAIVISLGSYEALICNSSRRRTKALCVLAAGLTQVVSMNLHLGALVVVPVLAGAAVAHNLSRSSLSGRRHDIGWSAAFIGLLSVATAATPLGIHIVSHSLQVRDASAGLIVEWTPGWRHGDALAVVALSLVAAIGSYKARRYAPVGAILVSVLLAMSAYRFEPLPALVALPEVAVMLSAWQRHLLSTTAFGARLRVVACVMAVPLLILGTVYVIRNFGAQPENTDLSVAAVKAVPSGCKILNDYMSGGLLILLRPDIKVSVDSRNDFYGRDQVESQRRVFDGGRFADQWIQTHQITCVLAATSEGNHDSGLADELSKAPGWTRLYADSSHILLVHSASLNGE